LAETARVITDLTRNEVPYKVPGKAEHQEALEKLKSQLSNAVTLHSIDFSKDFGVLVDASQFAVGCCVVQWNADGLEVPIAFASMKLSPTQARWSTIEREAFAVIWALNKFRPWVLLSKVTVLSDHNPLSYLTEASPKSAKLARWALALQEFNLVFKHRVGNQNVAADLLSRM
jgi:RNase H-like domain found in reverse transcriptase